MTDQDNAELVRRGAASDELDHTKCVYEVVSAKPSRQPKRVSGPGLHELISDGRSYEQMPAVCQQIETILQTRLCSPTKSTLPFGACGLGRMEN
jgi:hypothetical protein